MPSVIHEALILLFRNQPGLAPELLRDSLGTELPRFDEARIGSAELTEIPVVEDRALARRRPELAVLSSLAHPREAQNFRAAPDRPRRRGSHRRRPAVNAYYNPPGRYG